MTVVWIDNEDGVEELFTSPAAMQALTLAAMAAERHVDRFTPKASGTSARKVVAVGAVIKDGKAIAHVATHSSFWHWFEYGSIIHPPDRPFARGVQAAGLRFEATGR